MPIMWSPASLRRPPIALYRTPDGTVQARAFAEAKDEEEKPSIRARTSKQAAANLEAVTITGATKRKREQGDV